MIINGTLEQQSVGHLNDESGNTLRIHSIETFGTHDGPGIRMVVFLQGCQFRCLYCANPDTLDVKGGKLVEIEEIVKRAISQKSYFGKKGGVTVSGGEPLLQRSKLTLLFKRLHEAGIHTALDSNGKLLNEQVEAVLNETDLLLLDVKHFDNAWHHKLTGLSNESVFRVAEYREKSGMPIWLRYVLVPGYSDQEEHLHDMGRHFSGYKHIERIEILPYHKLGVHKWEALGMEYKLKDVQPPSASCIENTASIFRKYFSRVSVS